MPFPGLEDQIVTWPLENYKPGEASLIASENSISYLHLINPELDNRYLRGARQELVYKKISENLDGFIENNILVKDRQASLYIYQVINKGYTQMGIWTMTAVDDYRDGHIKKHEHTVERREQFLADYLHQTGLDANPVLLIYHPNAVIDRITQKYLKQTPILDFKYADGSHHTVWAICDLVDQHQIVSAFEKMDCVYIADGHHRAASMVKTGCRYFTTVYVNTEEVRILEYNRLIRDLGAINGEEFLQKVAASFELKESDKAVKPSRIHELGMYFNKQWYRLTVKDMMFNASDPVENLDVSILQRNVLEPLLDIQDPRADPRISFEGGATPISSLQQQVDDGLAALAFTLFPVSVNQLIKVADSNGIMPPKSTWIEPKFLIGLLTNYFG